MNEAGDNILSRECSRGNLEMIKALINKHVDLKSECLSVHACCYVVDDGIPCTEPVNKACDTPLSLACANGHLDTVKYLVNEHHCDPRSKLPLYVRIIHSPTHLYNYIDRIYSILLLLYHTYVTTN